ncbi:MAG: hypothetical protein NZ844_09990, partial [Chloroherpetonaceae bacterium]|nr:hypothetical protein [Chloroherpetonaceae bacterium]
CALFASSFHVRPVSVEPNTPLSVKAYNTLLSTQNPTMRPVTGAAAYPVAGRAPQTGCVGDSLKHREDMPVHKVPL